jgi:hypothetical protein
MPTYNHDMSNESEQKITEDLRSRLQQPDAVLDVIVELAPEATKVRTVPERREAFEKAVEPVHDAIVRCGGEVVGSAWLNRTVRAKVPAVKVSALGDLHEVATLDIPHRIHRE